MPRERLGEQGLLGSHGDAPVGVHGGAVGAEAALGGVDPGGLPLHGVAEAGGGPQAVDRHGDRALLQGGGGGSVWDQGDPRLAQRWGPVALGLHAGQEGGQVVQEEVREGAQLGNPPSIGAAGSADGLAAVKAGAARVWETMWAPKREA